MFQKVAQTGSFTRAAEECFISQSAVTQSMKKLEDQLGEVLFIRSKTGVTLTPQGKNLYEYINTSLETLNNAENLFEKYKNLETGELRIICESSLVRPILMKPLIEFTKKYPKVRIICSIDTYDDPFERIANGTFDICIFINPIKNDYECIEIEELTDSDMCFFTTKSYYDKCIKKKIGFKDLNAYKLILPIKGSGPRKWIDSKLEEKNIVLESNVELSNGSFVAGYIRDCGEGIGYGNLKASREIIGEKDFVKLIDDFEQERKEVAVAHLKSKILSPTVKEFLRLMGE
jgi:DNA-binding transcriptional LysR family regulator